MIYESVLPGNTRLKKGTTTTPHLGHLLRSGDWRPQHPLHTAMTDYAAKLLNELMGRNRDLLPEQQNNKLTVDSPEVGALATWAPGKVGTLLLLGSLHPSSLLSIT